MLNLLERLMIQLVSVARIALGQKEEQIGANHEAKNVTVLELEGAICVVLARYINWDLRVLNDVVLSMFLGDDAYFLLRIALGARLEGSLELLLVCEANLNRVQNLIEAVVDTNDLEVLEA